MPLMSAQTNGLSILGWLLAELSKWHREQRCRCSHPAGSRLSWSEQRMKVKDHDFNLSRLPQKSGLVFHLNFTCRIRWQLNFQLDEQRLTPIPGKCEPTFEGQFPLFIISWICRRSASESHGVEEDAHLPGHHLHELDLQGPEEVVGNLVAKTTPNLVGALQETVHSRKGKCQWIIDREYYSRNGLRNGISSPLVSMVVELVLQFHVKFGLHFIPGIHVKNGENSFVKIWLQRVWSDGSEEFILQIVMLFIDLCQGIHLDDNYPTLFSHRTFSHQSPFEQIVQGQLCIF